MIDPSPPNGPTAAGRLVPRWQAPLICVALAVITFAVFGQTLRHEFVNYDDNEYVCENPMVARGLTFKSVVWAFTHVHSTNWHPLTWISHMLDCQLYGLHPGGHHLTNVLLHAATAIALFLVLRQMTGAVWRSAFVAAVFAIHPLRVESVAWVAERKDVLSGLFFMLTLGAYVQYARSSRSIAKYGLVMFLFALGLMSKPMLVTLPVLLLLLDYWPLQRVEPGKLSSLVVEKLPLFGLSALSCVATLLAQQSAFLPADFFPPLLRFSNAVETCAVYLSQMFWPARLAVFYPIKGLSSWDLLLAGGLLAALSAMAWVERRKRPWLLVGWLWYLTMLLPVIGVIQVGLQAHADRYTYLPGIGVCLALTWFAAEWNTSRVVSGSLAVGVLSVLMICAWKQTAYWQNSETLWNHTLACTTRNAVAHLNLSADLIDRGKLDESIAHSQAALEIRPGYARAHYNLGTALLRQDRLDQAVAELQTALRIKPAYPEARSNLGNALLKKGRVDEAIAELQMALRMKPDDVKARSTLGDALLKQGKVDEAIAQFKTGLQIKPGQAEVRYNLGNALMTEGKVDEAIAQFQIALQIKPQDSRAHNNLANSLVLKGKLGEAIIHFQQALRFDPSNPSIQNNLAWLLATCPDTSLRDSSKAVELALQADQRTGGKNPLVLHTLAAALAGAGRYPEAVETAQRALALAEAQSNKALAGALQSEVRLYQANKPYANP